MVLTAIFDPMGTLSGWSEADRLYSPHGDVTGWLRGGAVYSIDGEHVGWYERGQFRDDRGCVVGWTRPALGGPSKPATRVTVSPAELGSAPAYPCFSRRMGRIPFSASWSSESWPAASSSDHSDSNCGADGLPGNHTGRPTRDVHDSLTR